jgi:hypothetical protein
MVMSVDQAVVRPADRSRTSWPELVGYSDWDAAFLITYDRPDVSVDFYNVGLTVPAGHPEKHAIVFRDERLIVVIPPYIG